MANSTKEKATPKGRKPDEDDPQSAREDRPPSARPRFRHKPKVPTLAQEAFVDHLLADPRMNATKAAEAAGLACPRQAASRLLSNADIRRMIAERTADRAMAADQTLGLLADHAFIPHRLFCRFDEATQKWVFDLDTAIKNNVDHLIRRYTRRPDGTEHIEPVDSQEALKTIAKHLGLLKDRIEIETKPDVAKLRSEILEKLGRGEN
jgi:hypothetical protein